MKFQKCFYSNSLFGVTLNSSKICNWNQCKVTNYEAFAGKWLQVFVLWWIKFWNFIYIYFYFGKLCLCWNKCWNVQVIKFNLWWVFCNMHTLEVGAIDFCGQRKSWAFEFDMYKKFSHVNFGLFFTQVN